MTRGQQFAKTMRYTLSIGTRTRRHTAGRDLHAEILDAINETNLYPGCRNEETEAIFRTALAAYWSHQKHIAGYRVDCRLVAHINAMSPWQFCNLLGRMIDADITNVGEGELFYAELRTELFPPTAPATEIHNETETNVTEYGIFEDGACIEAGFHGETGKAAAEEHVASLVAAHTEMADAYEVLALCPDHEEQPRRDCEECATDGDDLGPGFCMECGETPALDAHQEETGHEMDQPDHPLNAAISVEQATEEEERADVNTAATEQDPGPSLDDYAKASRIIQSLIPGVRR
ncbi:hypothetical protein [Streptomyces sp. NPDC012888]|uniref:hypothetical protein n=1 Tax=Streptomyces sp. NPDC012888 TaxID=3364855 RepID=UPI0036B9523F